MRKRQEGDKWIVSSTKGVQYERQIVNGQAKTIRRITPYVYKGKPSNPNKGPKREEPKFKTLPPKENCTYVKINPKTWVLRPNNEAS